MFGPTENTWLTPVVAVSKMLSNVYEHAVITLCDCRANLNGDHC